MYILKREEMEIITDRSEMECYEISDCTYKSGCIAGNGIQNMKPLSLVWTRCSMSDCQAEENIARYQAH
jgi:hypothetical protein